MRAPCVLAVEELALGGPSGAQAAAQRRGRPLKSSPRRGSGAKGGCPEGEQAVVPSPSVIPWPEPLHALEGPDGGVCFGERECVCQGLWKGGGGGGGGVAMEHSGSTHGEGPCPPQCPASRAPRPLRCVSPEKPGEEPTDPGRSPSGCGAATPGRPEQRSCFCSRSRRKVHVGEPGEAPFLSPQLPGPTIISE